MNEVGMEEEGEARAVKGCGCEKKEIRIEQGWEEENKQGEQKGEENENIEIGRRTDGGEEEQRRGTKVKRNEDTKTRNNEGSGKRESGRRKRQEEKQREGENATERFRPVRNLCAWLERNLDEGRQGKGFRN